MTPFRGIIKFTIDSVPIPAGSWQDVNKMLGPVELGPFKICLKYFFDDLAFGNIWKTGRRAAPTKKVFFSFRKACADWSACQISNLWDQSFTCLQINGQMLDPLDPRNILCNIFAVFLLCIVVIVVTPQWSVLESSLLNLEPDNKCPTPRVGGSSTSSNTHNLCLKIKKEKLKIFVQFLIVQRSDLVFWQLVLQDSRPFLNKCEHKFTFDNLKVKQKT